MAAGKYRNLASKLSHGEAEEINNNGSINMAAAQQISKENERRSIMPKMKKKSEMKKVIMKKVK